MTNRIAKKILTKKRLGRYSAAKMERAFMRRNRYRNRSKVPFFDVYIPYE